MKERMGVDLYRWGVREILGGAGGWESITRIYCMKKYFSIKKTLKPHETEIIGT